MPRLTAFLDQQPPFEHDVFGDGQTRSSNIGRTLCASQSLSSARLLASATSSMPKRISAKVTALT
jgi:hypothetical protein